MSTQTEQDAPSGRRTDTTGGRQADPAPPTQPTPAEAFHEATARLGEVKEYAAYFVSAKIDAIKVTIRNVGIFAALGVIGLMAGAGMIVTAAVLLLVGIAHGLGALMGGMNWLGDLIVGVVVLGAVVAGVFIVMSRLTKTSRKRIVEKYENRKRDQRQTYGHDVRERAEHAKQS